MRKVIVNGNITKDRLYIGANELYRKYVSGALDTERETLHMSDDTGRICVVETLTVETGAAVSNPTNDFRWQYSNHLGSAALELDETGQIISYEEYHPFGTSAYRSGRSASEVSLKRYRYVGKERDDETGLYYYGARYYAAWLCRFVSVDPLKDKFSQLNPYNYAGNKPVTWMDIDGMQSPAEETPPATVPNESGLATVQASPGTDFRRNPSAQPVPTEAPPKVFSQTPPDNPQVGDILGSTIQRTDYAINGDILSGDNGSWFSGESANYWLYIYTGDSWAIVGFSFPDGSEYFWNDKANWYVDSEGNDFDDYIFMDMLNGVGAGIKPIALGAIDAVNGRDPLAGVKGAYAAHDGNMASFVASNLWNGVTGMVSDLAAGGHRGNQAFLGLFGYSSAPGTGFTAHFTSRFKRFFSVQSIADTRRLLGDGKPWPTGSTSAN